MFKSEEYMQGQQSKGNVNPYDPIKQKFAYDEWAYGRVEQTNAVLERKLGSQDIRVNG